MLDKAHVQRVNGTNNTTENTFNRGCFQFESGNESKHDEGTLFWSLGRALTSTFTLRPQKTLTYVPSAT